MVCHSNSCRSGKIDGRVTAINFDAPSRVSLGTNSCAMSIHDMFVSKPCPTNGDSGGAIFSDDGYVLGLITYGSTSKGGRNDTRCMAYNPSAIHMPQTLDVTVGQGIVGGGPAPLLTPGGIANPNQAENPKQAPSNLYPNQQKRRQQQQGRGWFTVYQDYLTIA